MTVQNSTAVRNAQGDAWETAMGTAAKIQFWTGAQPANCAAASSGTKLAEYAMASDWCAAGASGAKTLNSLPLECRPHHRQRWHRHARWFIACCPGLGQLSPLCQKPGRPGDARIHGPQRARFGAVTVW